MSEHEDLEISKQEKECNKVAEQTRTCDLPKPYLVERLAYQESQRDHILSLMKSTTDEDMMKKLRKRLDYWELGVRYYRTLINEQSV